MNDFNKLPMEVLCQKLLIAASNYLPPNDQLILEEILRRKDRANLLLTSNSSNSTSFLINLGWQFEFHALNEWKWKKYQDGQVIASQWDNIWKEDIKALEANLGNRTFI